MTKKEFIPLERFAIGNNTISGNISDLNKPLHYFSVETRQTHEKLMNVLKKVQELNIPEDSKFYISGHLVSVIREMHKCVLEEIREEKSIS